MSSPLFLGIGWFHCSGVLILAREQALFDADELLPAMSASLLVWREKQLKSENEVMWLCNRINRHISRCLSFQTNGTEVSINRDKATKFTQSFPEHSLISTEDVTTYTGNLIDISADCLGFKYEKDVIAELRARNTMRPKKYVPNYL
jgi:hypothetical protein